MLRMLALYRSGRQAEALQAFRDTRSAFVDAARDRARRGAAGAARADPAPGGGARCGRRAGQVTARSRARSCARCSADASCPCSGSPAPTRSSSRLGEAFAVPGERAGRARPRDAVRRRDAGPRAAARRAPRDVRCRRATGPVHRLLARLPALLRERRCPLPAHRDDRLRSLPRARLRRGRRGARRRHVHRRRARMRGRFVHSPPGGEPRIVDVPNAYADVSLERRTVLLRLRGTSTPAPTGPWESLVVTEDDHIDYPGAGRARGGDPRDARCAPAAQPSALPRLRPRRLEPPARRQPPARRHVPCPMRRGRCARRRRRSSSPSGAGSTSRRWRWTRAPLPASSKGGSTAMVIA